MNYDSWLNSSKAYEEFIGEDEEETDYDYCDEHEEQWKIDGKW